MKEGEGENSSNGSVRVVEGTPTGEMNAAVPRQPVQRAGSMGWAPGGAPSNSNVE